MSRVTYVSLMALPEDKLMDLMDEGETPHLTLILFGKGNDPLAEWIAETIRYCPGWANGTLREVSSPVYGQAVYGRGLRVLLLDPEPLDPIRTCLFEWCLEWGIKPDSAAGAWSPHVTLGKDTGPVPERRLPEKLTFSAIRVNGATVHKSQALI